MDPGPSGASALVMGYNPNAVDMDAAEAEAERKRLKRHNSGRGSQPDLGVLATTSKYREGATVAEVNPASLCITLLRQCMRTWPATLEAADIIALRRSSWSEIRPPTGRATW